MSLPPQPRAVIASVAIGQSDVEDDRIEMRVIVGKNLVGGVDVRCGGYDEFTGLIEILRQHVPQRLVVLDDQDRSPVRHDAHSPRLRCMFRHAKEGPDFVAKIGPRAVALS